MGLVFGIPYSPAWKRLTTIAALAIISVASVRSAFAERSIFQVYDTSQGLGSLGGTCMIQDPAGFMLVCTEHGVYAYDGRRFVNLGPQQGLRSGGFVQSIERTSTGQIAVAYADEVLVSEIPAGVLRSPQTLFFRAVQQP